MEGREEAMTADKEAMKTRIESLVTRLKDTRDASSHQEDGYNAEIKAQTDLANCYKTKASDAEDKCADLLVQSVQRGLLERTDCKDTWTGSIDK